jgi:HK97 gp10 family phage protein
MSETKPVRIDGIKDIRRSVNRLGKDLDKDAAKGALKEMNAEAAEKVKQTAAGLVPVRTGQLASTLRASGTQKSARVRAGTKRVPYAAPIHFGWPARNISPQPFLYDALDKRRNEVVDIYEKRLSALIRKYRLY